MDAKTYEIIIETLIKELEMERWQRKQAEKRAKELTTDLEKAKMIIDELQKTEGFNG